MRTLLLLAPLAVLVSAGWNDAAPAASSMRVSIAVWAHGRRDGCQIDHWDRVSFLFVAPA